MTGISYNLLIFLFLKSSGLISAKSNSYKSNIIVRLVFCIYGLISLRTLVLLGQQPVDNFECKTPFLTVPSSLPAAI